MVAVTLGLFGLIKGVAWPLVTLLIVIGLKPQIVTFLPNAFALILRSRKVEVLGVLKVEVDAAEQQKAVVASNRAEGGKMTYELKEIPGLPRSTAMARVEHDLHARLSDVTADPIDVLIRNLAQARLEAGFGIAYAGIFGSQLNGLIELEARRRVSANAVYNFYKETEEKYPEIYNEYGFAGWLGFLKSNGLVESDKDDIVISDTGDDFLTWLRVKKLSTAKPF